MKLGDQGSLSLLWAGAFVAAIGSVLYLTWIVRLGPATTGALFELVIGQYSPYLGAVLGFYFAKRSEPATESRNTGMAYWLAITMSALWNVMILGALILICSDSNRAPEAIQQVKETMPKLAWIVAPAIGYFFGKPKEA